MQGPPPEPAGQPPRPPVAPPDVKGVPEGSASKARPVGPRAHSKAVSPVGPRAEMRSRSPRTSLFNKAPAEPDATSVPMAAPAPEPVRYSDTAVPVPLNLAEGQGTPLEQALAGEEVAWI